MDVTVSILVLTFNRVDFSSAYIPRLVDRIGDIPHEVLIWDNASEDGSFDWAHTYGQAEPAVAHVIGNRKNIGMEAFNPLAKKARGKYILKVDDDIEVPPNFAQRMVDAFEIINEEKLMFLGWDMPWGEKTFATRSGMKLYKEPMGKIVPINKSERALINYDPSHWMVNGVCRLSRRDTFLSIGGHPKGVVYGVDKHISAIAAKNGYWTGYYSSKDLVIHRGINDSKNYRAMKNKQLKKFGSPLHV